MPAGRKPKPANMIDKTNGENKMIIIDEAHEINTEFYDNLIDNLKTRSDKPFLFKHTTKGNRTMDEQ